MEMYQALLIRSQAEALRLKEEIFELKDKLRIAELEADALRNPIKPYA